MVWTGGRAPASQNKRLPCAGSRWPAEARGSPPEGLQLLGQIGRNARPLSAIDLGLLDPVMQRLRRAGSERSSILTRRQRPAFLFGRRVLNLHELS
jgi:hypothetical protein